MNRLSFKTICLSLAVLFGATLVPASVLAETTQRELSASDVNSKNKVANLIASGDKEIARRLNTLAKLGVLINGARKLSPADKANLTAQVNNEISDLNSLKTKLDADSDLAVTRTDAASIVSNYRVYALIVPKVHLLTAAGRELANDDNLTALATKLQTRITEAKNGGKDVTAMQASLDDMSAKITAAQGLANTVNAKVAPLVPTDYNSDHTILDGQRDQLKTAHQDNQAAYQDAKTIVVALKG